jgi:hypothetical protein
MRMFFRLPWRATRHRVPISIEELHQRIGAKSHACVEIANLAGPAESLDPIWAKMPGVAVGNVAPNGVTPMNEIPRSGAAILLSDRERRSRVARAGARLSFRSHFSDFIKHYDTNVSPSRIRDYSLPAFYQRSRRRIQHLGLPRMAAISRMISDDMPTHPAASGIAKVST